MISDETINEVRDRTDIVALVGRHVTLKKAGTLYKGLCPFHEEKSPSFTVSPTRNTYHCFGCGVHGDCFRFIVETENRSFPEAVRALAEAAGVAIPEEKPLTAAKQAERQEKKDTHRRLLDLQDKLCAYYTAQLFSDRGQPAQRYLAERGIERRTAEAFRIGYASGDKIPFHAWVEEHSVDREDLAALGVLLRPEEGWSVGQRLWGGYLRFRERVMFPIIDLRGEVVGFSGRVLVNDKKTAKYINSPETPVFTKGDELYGAYTARTAARRAGRVVLVEGNIDVVMLWQAGLEGTVAPMGTALTDKQVRLVGRLAENVVCVMDGDAAGTKAAFASLEPFLAEGISPRAVMLPEGDDPDSFVRREGIDAFTAEIEAAAPLLDLFIERVAHGHPPDLQGRVAALRAIAPALARLDDPLAAELYKSRVASTLEVPAHIVASAIAEATGAAHPEARADGRTAAHTEARTVDARRDARAPAASAMPGQRTTPGSNHGPGHDSGPDRGQNHGQNRSHDQGQDRGHDPGYDLFGAPDFGPPPDHAGPPPGTFETLAPFGHAPFRDPPGHSSPAESAPTIAPRVVRPLRVAGYTQKLFEFLVQYPTLVTQLCDEAGALRPGFLAHEGLTAFVHTLYREVSRTTTPSFDRLLTALDEQGHPETVAFLRDCQARRPDQTRDTIERAFEDVLRRCKQGHLKAEQQRALAEFHRLKQIDHAQAAEYYEINVRVIKRRLAELDQSHAEGAH